jgi:tRNA 2-thiocytidine biosynthesis protein TtcA
VIIRPLAYCSEREIERYADIKQFPIIPCNLCGSQENLQRAQIKQLLQTWEREHPGRIETLFSSLQNVTPSHLADTQLFDFASLGNLRSHTSTTS